ncbi:MAG: T9SS type A sorting domain-containing protein [Melioribacteraceae bacterium]|nr:T9SS type A sorting domain-containing protein [Melioribacteraceae bacterium]
MMRKINLFFLLVITLPLLIHGQNGWNWVSTPVDSIKRHIWDVHFFSPDTGWFMGQGQDGVYTRLMFGFTIDGGISWDSKIFGFGADYTVDFWDKLLSIKFDGAFNRTVDGWITDTKPFVDTIGFAAEGKFASATHVYAGGLNTILKSIDSGLTWSYIQPEGLEFGRIFGVSPIDTNIVYFISGEKLLKTSDGGINWEDISLPPNHNVRYRYLKFLTEDYGWITGEFRTIFLTTNGGESWINQCPPVDYDSFNKFDAFDEHTAVAVSSAGAIFWTNDGGETWIEQVPKEIYPMLTDVQIVTREVAYAVGWYGTMLKTTTGGVTWIEEDNDINITNKYELKQNYPNPFNPTTKIKFTIPNVGDENIRPLQTVKLIIYDILGREVATLVNKHLTPGNYEVEFNAEGLSSGVYYYRLEAGSCSQTKKMILLR